jgi:hypothetical protein
MEHRGQQVVSLSFASPCKTCYIHRVHGNATLHKVLVCVIHCGLEGTYQQSPEAISLDTCTRCLRVMIRHLSHTDKHCDDHAMPYFGNMGYLSLSLHISIAQEWQGK